MAGLSPAAFVRSPPCSAFFLHRQMWSTGRFLGKGKNHLGAAGRARLGEWGVQWRILVPTDLEALQGCDSYHILCSTAHWVLFICLLVQAFAITL